MSSYMVNFGPLTAEICLASLGHPSKFQRVSRLGFVLQRCCSTEANQTLHDVWASPGLVHYIYILGGSCPITEFCHVQHSLCFQVLRSPIYWQSYCTSLEQWASATVCLIVQGMELRNFGRRRHLCSAGRPLRWSSAHILVYVFVHIPLTI